MKQKGIRFYTGVPDSLFKDFLSYLQDYTSAGEHVITANEGLAVALASGHYLSTGQVPVVYLQNSGLGNIVNPLTSLADKEMFAIPMMLLIGWRGRPGVKDEPQHKKMGRITLPLLDTLEVPFYLLEPDEAASLDKIEKAMQRAAEISAPVALVLPEGIFEKYRGRVEMENYKLIREEVIREIIAALQGKETVVCSTGKIGREFEEQNRIAGKKIGSYLLSPGAMGHAGHIAIGLESGEKRKIIFLDGDGAMLMHLGALPLMTRIAGNDFVHVLINNGSHESVGGQPTGAFMMDCCGIATACGYKKTTTISNEAELKKWLTEGLFIDEKQFVEIRTNRFSRPDLGRPGGEPAEWKKEFMRSLKKKNAR